MAYGSGHVGGGVHHATHAVSYGYGGWGTYWLQRRLIRGIFFCIFAVVAIVIIVGSTVGSTVGTGGSDDSTSQTYYPGETSIISKGSNALCSSLKLTSFASFTALNLYSLSKPPVLAPGDDIDPISDTSTWVYSYSSWSYYLHEGSIISLDICRQKQSSIKNSASVLLIRGTRNFNQWKKHYNNVYAYQTHRVSDESCPTHTAFNFTISSGLSDVWYVVVNNEYDYGEEFSINLIFHTTEYKVIQQDVLNSCHLCAACYSCTIPTTQGATYLLVADTSYLTDYTDTFTADVRCVITTGAIVGIVVGSVAFVVIVIVIITSVIICCCCCKKKKSPAVQAGAEVQPRRVVTVCTGTVIGRSAADERTPVNPRSLPNAPPPYTTAPPPTAPPPYRPSTYQPANYGSVQHQ